MKPNTQPVPLVERLKSAGQRWAAAHDASLARLGRLVVNDGGYFSRIDSNPVTTTATLEKFAQFLGDTANWPNQTVPAEVIAFVHVTGITATSEEPATGQCSGMSGDARGAA